MLRSTLVPVASLLVLAGCLTHLPPAPNMRHRSIHWAASFEEARALALREGKPLLACLVAGARDGLC